MGSWYGTCAISNLHIKSGQDVAVFILLENKEKKTFCYENALYDLCPIPFYGKYNDYGAVEECHGIGMDIIVDELRNRLYEFGQGPNSCHDIPVNKANFNIEMLFEADHEDRLGIEDSHSYNYNQDKHDLRGLEKKKAEDGLTDSQQFELDRLANKIKKIDTFRRATHVIVHGDIFRDIMEKRFIETYVGSNNGNTGYDNAYRKVSFKDIAQSIPTFIEKLKALTGGIYDPITQLIRNETRSENFNDRVLAMSWMENALRNNNGGHGFIRLIERMTDYVDNKEWDQLSEFMHEIITVAWINDFMSGTRKVWTQTCGKGSQNQDHGDYRFLIQSMTDALDKEKKEYDEDEDEEDEE